MPSRGHAMRVLDNVRHRVEPRSQPPQRIARLRPHLPRRLALLCELDQPCHEQRARAALRPRASH